MSDEIPTIKDANDWLKAMVAEGVDPEAQAELVRARLSAAPTIIEMMAEWAGQLEGAERMEAEQLVAKTAKDLKPTERSHLRKRLCKLMGIGVREFNDLLSASKEENKKDKSEVTYTLGGFIKGWLVEYLYDETSGEASLAYRDPKGVIGSAKELTIEGDRYAPRTPDELVKNGVVIFPSDIGKPKDNLELVAIVEQFINRHYLLDNRKLGRLIAYWVLMTWIYDGLEALPYLRAMGDAGSGKSELLRRVGYVCYRMTTTGGAGSESSFFRITEMYRGTVFMDEMDLADGGGMDNPKIKFLNLGAMRGNPIIRMEEGYDEAGKRTFVPVSNRTFCPKLIAMRKDFLDDAVGTRCITIQTFEKFPEELRAAGVSLQLTGEFYEQAREIRNLLLYWRLRNWKERYEVDASLVDERISSRLNQVTIGLKIVAKDDPRMLADMEQFLREYYRDLMLTKNMGKAARVIEAIWKIYSYPDLRMQMVMANGDGREYMFVGHVTRIANEIMDVMNSLAEDEEEGGDEEGKPKRSRGRRASPRSVGEIIRRELQLQMGQRRGDGYPVFWDEVRMRALATRYGVDIENLPKVKREVESAKEDGQATMKI